MCPNNGKMEKICPGRPGTVHEKPSPCDFVKSWRDEKGIVVFAGSLWNDGRIFMSFRINPRTGGTHRVVTKQLPERKSFDEAQRDLNRYAVKKMWKEDL
jgi:hypothetical protein